MSYTRNLARLARTGAPVVDTAQNLRDLLIYNGLYPEAVHTLGSLSIADEGGGLWRWDASSVAADNLATVLMPTGHVGAGRWMRVFIGSYHVSWWGAMGDGVTADENAIQAAIDYVTTLTRGGAIEMAKDGEQLYSVTELTLKSNVKLVGSDSVLGVPGRKPTIYGRDPNTRWIIKTDSQTVSAGLHGLGIVGTGVTSLQGGVYIGGTGVSWNSIIGCVFDYLGYQAIRDGDGISGGVSIIQDNFAWNCLMQADNLTDYMGVLELRASDSYVIRGEYTASRSSGISASGKACACAHLSGAFTTIIGSVFEISDIGFYAGTGVAGVKMTNVRCDLNAGHGFYLTGSNGIMLGCQSAQNGRAAPSTYDNFRFIGPNSWILTACTSSDNTVGKPLRRAFYADTASDVNFCSFNGCRHIGNPCDKVWDVPSTQGPDINSMRLAPVTIIAAPVMAWPNNGEMRQSIICYNNTGAPVTVTTFPAGIAGQLLTVYFQSSIAASTITVASTGGNITFNDTLPQDCISGTTLQFLWHGNTWRNIGPVGLKRAGRTVAPTSSTDTGKPYTWYIAGTDMYICTAVNTWRKVTMTAF